jgi:epoxide hydrolase 4
MVLPIMKFSFRSCNGINLHIAEAGPDDGQPVILLHGFPDFWYGWRDQIGALAGAGFRVIAPDQRGYNLSDKPRGVTAYDIDQLADDIAALIDSYGVGKMGVVGHDWGGHVAWHLTARHPHRLERAVILNCPHPAVWRNAMDNDPLQRKASSYVKAFAIPILPELLLRFRNYAPLMTAMNDSRVPLSPDDEARYRAAWSQPGALTGSINWYRSFLKRHVTMPAPRSIATPVRLMWGLHDKYGVPALAEASIALCANGILRNFPEATHWLPHDEAVEVNEELIGFLKG